MSHIVTIKTEIRDAAAVAAACRVLNLDAPQQGTAELFSDEATGLMVRLPGWRFPVICDTATGTLQYDNYGGRWGQQQQLDRFLQAYAVEKSKIEARRQGRSVAEQMLADGSIKLTIQLDGGAA